MKLLRTKWQSAIVMSVLALGLTFQSCQEDDPLKDVPSITISTSQTNNTTGATVSTDLTIAAPEGLKIINILKNGVLFDTVQVAGSPTSHNWTFEYTLVEPIGTTVNITFIAVDTKDRSSEAVLFRIGVTAKPIREIAAGNLIGNHTWHNDTIYRLNGFVRVGRDVQTADPLVFTNVPGTLTIEPGTLIIGDKESKGTLIVQRGSRIIADGTRENPIVMTSEAPRGQRLPGDWGGLVICGRVTNNIGANVQLEGGYGAWHGGTVAASDINESSGVLRFVRIEYAGIPINPNEEVNSLTLGSVGRGTVIEHVQASYGLDDAFEWFGGSVNAKNLISYRGLDDDIDADQGGYSGFVQFVLIIRDPNLADQSGSNGFEVDNTSGGAATTPFTSARFSNVTVIGPKKTRETTINTNFQHGAQLRRNSMLRIYNSFITGFPHGVYIDDTRGMTSTHVMTDSLRLRNVIIAGVEGWGGNGFGTLYDAVVEGTVTGLPFVDGAGVARPNHPTLPRGVSLRQDGADLRAPGFDIVPWFNTAAHGNRRLAKWQDAGINPTIFDLVANPGVLPLSGSILRLNAADATAAWNRVPAADRANFEPVPFIGAFGDVDWTAGWAEWLPNEVVYF